MLNPPTPAGMEAVDGMPKAQSVHLTAHSDKASMEGDALPKPCTHALVRGLGGSEYRPLSEDYEPNCAMFSPVQMLAAIAAERERCAAVCEWVNRHELAAEIRKGPQ